MLFTQQFFHLEYLFWLFDFDSFNFATWVYLCVYSVLHWVDIVEKNLLKPGGLEKKIQTGGWPYRWGFSIGGDSDYLYTMLYGLVFLPCASIFRWTQLISPITIGYKLLPFSHYIRKIGIYISNESQGILVTAFRVFDLLVPNIMVTKLQPDNACRAINDSVILWWNDAIDLLMLISLLASVKTSMYSFVNNQLIFLKFEIQKYIHSQIHYTISGIVPVTTSEEVSDHFFTNIQMEIKFTFTLYTDIYITRT